MTYVRELIREYQLEPADVVVVKKAFLGMLDHYMVFAGYDDSGRPWFIANFGKGVDWLGEDYLLSASGYFSVSRVRYFEGNSYQRQKAMQRAESLLGKSYSKWQFNCEHYANYVQKGQAYSQQVQTASGIGKGLAVGIGFLAVAGLISAAFSDE